MTFLSLELFTAPRLEQDVCTFYKDVRFKRHDPALSYQEQSNAVIGTFRTALLQYFKDWNLMMVSHRDYDLSFWSSTFRKVYTSVLYEYGIAHFYPAGEKNETWLINQIAFKLQKLFKTTGFIEMLNKVNNDYEKRVDKIRTSYRSTSELSVDAVDLRFNLGFYDQFNEFMDIQSVMKMFNIFEKQLKMQAWYRAQSVFTLYHVFRDVEQNRYVICLFLTIDKVMYSVDTKYDYLISQLWNRVTDGYGGLLQSTGHFSIDFNISGHITPLIIGGNDIFNASNAMNPLDYLDSLPTNETAFDESSKKICVLNMGASALKGFSAMKGC